MIHNSTTQYIHFYYSNSAPCTSKFSTGVFTDIGFIQISRGTPL